MAVDPAKSGPSFVLGDLSTHTFYMSELICPQLKLEAAAVRLPELHQVPRDRWRTMLTS
ncbi:MAG: hypothetical protein ACLR4Z_16980 [Butyricicoccaceae bacterium]